MREYESLGSGTVFDEVKNYFGTQRDIRQPLSYQSSSGPFGACNSSIAPESWLFTGDQTISDARSCLNRDTV